MSLTASNASMSGDTILLATPESPAFDVKDILVSESVGTFGGTSGWGIFVSRFIDLPNSSDSIIGIYDSGDIIRPDPKWRLDFPLIKILVRGPKNDYDAAYEKCREISQTLVGKGPININNSLYVSFRSFGEINFLAYDVNNRPIFSLRFLLIRQTRENDNRLALPY